jgi:predicted NUDIX family NTP pyrophosphohydrolase
MARVSAGLLMYRIRDGKLQVLLAHPSGPFLKKKDDGAWTIPKGETEQGEDFPRNREARIRGGNRRHSRGPVRRLLRCKMRKAGARIGRTINVSCPRLLWTAGSSGLHRWSIVGVRHH